MVQWIRHITPLIDKILRKAQASQGFSWMNEGARFLIIVSAARVPPRNYSSMVKLGSSSSGQLVSYRITLGVAHVRTIQTLVHRCLAGQDRP